jgi:hypothetical protein
LPALFPSAGLAASDGRAHLSNTAARTVTEPSGGPIFVNSIGDGASALMKQGPANACPKDRE